MTAPAITSLAMTDEYDIFTQVGPDGRTIELACNHEVVSNLVQTRIKTEIDESLWIENTELNESLLAQQLRFVIRNTYGVLSTDFTNFELRERDRILEYGPLCFTVDCANSEACLVI